ncbi:MAG: hypothetical protein HY908_07155, partial [Myxococcales bacterium]|nr:hypothetical protein [Myxococcales bacterium]
MRARLVLRQWLRVALLLAAAFAIAGGCQGDSTRRPDVDVGPGALVAGLEREGDTLLLRGTRVSSALPLRADAPVRLASTGSADVSWLEVRALGREPALGELDAVAPRTLVYRSAEPDTDVTLRVDEAGFEEVRHLASPAAPTDARYAVKLGPALVRLRARAHIVEALDAEERVVFRTRPAFAIDAAGTVRRVEVALEDEATVVASLDTEGLVYPIAVDPAWVAADLWPEEAVVALNSTSLASHASVAGDLGVVDVASGPELSAGWSAALASHAKVTGSVAGDRVKLAAQVAVTGDVSANVLQAHKTVAVGGTRATRVALPLDLEVPLVTGCGAPCEGASCGGAGGAGGAGGRPTGAGGGVVGVGGGVERGGAGGCVGPRCDVGPMPSAVVAVGTCGSGTADVDVPANGGEPLAPGSYRDVVLGAERSLVLMGGVYDLRSLTVGEHARLECEAPCDVFVAERLSAAAHAFIGPSTGTTDMLPSDVALVVRGGNGGAGTPTAEPAAADIGEHATIQAHALVSAGTLMLRSHVGWLGVAAGLDVALGPHSYVDRGVARKCGELCTRLVAADCAAGPSSPKGCTLDCRKALEGACDVEHAAFVACATTGAPAVSCVNGVPRVIACDGNEWADVLQCVAAHAGDGDACTFDELACFPGHCAPEVAVTHIPLSVDDSNECTVDSCDPINGTVHHTNVPDGTECADADPCNGVDRCVSGVCRPGAPPALHATPCSHEVCVPGVGVEVVYADSTTSCDDADLCTGVDICDGAGTCAHTGGPAIDDQDQNGPTIDLCDPETGDVTHTPVPELDGSVATSAFEAGKFLYLGVDGSPPVQDLADPTVIDPLRATVITGHVTDASGTALAGVRVSARIAGQPAETPGFGSTLTDPSGRFLIVANGGGPVTLGFEKAQYLTAERRVAARANDYTIAPDVVLTLPDPVLPTVVVPAASLEVVVGRVVSDAAGVRQPVIVLPAGTAAYVNGMPLSTLSLRMTEYTAGDLGPALMPAELPPTSQYTYALEISAEEAGDAPVVFSAPVLVYVDNFLGLPVGTDVPVGFYDPALAGWVPAPDGRVVRVVAGGLDLDGGGSADGPALLAALGISPEELAAVVGRYPVGTSVWRVPVPHLSTSDFNFGSAPPDDACDPLDPTCHPDGCQPGDPGCPEDGCAANDPACVPPRDPKDPLPPDDPCLRTSSIIECQGQVLGERVPVVGTPFALHYASDRVPGRSAARTFDIPLTLADPGTIPPSLKRIEVEVDVAGQRFPQSFVCPAACGPFATATFSGWDGTDVLGRRLQGKTPVKIRVGYVYDAFYVDPPPAGSSFGSVSGVSLGVPARQEVTRWKTWERDGAGWDAAAAGLGGFSLSVHHAYDPKGHTLYLGDGSRRSIASTEPVLERVAGGNDLAPVSDPGPALDAYFSNVEGLAVAADGSIFVADFENHRVRRISRVGTVDVVTTVAGTGVWASGNPALDGDGGPASLARVDPLRVALGLDGSLYVLDQWGRVHRVTPDVPEPMIRVFAGNGALGDGADARDAHLDQPSDIAVGPDGVVYILESGNAGRLRKVGLDGKIATVAGGGIGAPPGRGLEISIPGAAGLALGPDGSVYFGWVDQIWRVTPDGMVRAFAGTGIEGATGDGGPATAARLNRPSFFAVGADGSLFATVRDVTPDLNWEVPGVRRIDPRGVITTLAGGRNPRCIQFTNCGFGGPAAASQLGARGLAAAPDGSLIVGGHTGASPATVARVRTPLPGVTLASIVIPSADGGEAYVFSPQGRHLATHDALLGAVRYAFGYDSAGRLESVTDRDGLVTTIVRDASGAPTSIVGQYGQVTALEVGTDGYLSSITNPNAEQVKLAYDPGGLLKTYTDGRTHATQYAYDALGRLTKATDASGGWQQLVRTDDAAGGYSVELTTALLHAATYGVGSGATGSRMRTNVFPGVAASATTVVGLDGRRTTTRPDGTTVTSEQVADPRFGYLAPVQIERRVRTPGLLELERKVTREVTLAVPHDPLSLASSTETLTLNGRAFTTVYDAATRTLTRTTPLGRERATTFDALGHVVEVSEPGRLPVTLTYDAAGRLATLTQGSRTWRRTYDAFGRVASVRGPLQCQPDTLHTTCADDAACPANHVCLLPEGACVEDPAVAQCLLRGSSFGYDLANRPTTSTRPDDHVIGTSYDANGNAKTVTPPGRPAHL